MLTNNLKFKRNLLESVLQNSWYYLYVIDDFYIFYNSLEKIVLNKSEFNKFLLDLEIEFLNTYIYTKYWIRIIKVWWEKFFLENTSNKKQTEITNLHISESELEKMINLIL
jgi:hypothetical protein